ncbi:MAG: hypothetical protein MJ084_03525 [Saccharofermentans sp.]|nr:hypothetical protein [Saccharofermentans sp.]
MVTISQRVRTIVLAVIFCFLTALAVFLIVQNMNVSQITVNKVTRKCPYDIPENYQWTLYPDDNILGLTASMCVGDAGKTSLILVFDFSKATDGVEEAIEKSDDFVAGFGSQVDPGAFFDSKEVISKGAYTYVKVRFDSAASLSDVNFYRGQDIMQRKVELEINNGEVIKLKYFADKESGKEGYYLGQTYFSNDSVWGEPGYSEVVKDVL